MTPKKNRLVIHHDFVPFLLLIAIVLWFSHEMVWGGKVPFFRDLGPYFYPMRFSLAESFKHGELPLWDPHVAMGFPLLADFQSGAFYPPNLFYLAFPFFTAVRTTFLFHYLIAATGSYLLCRGWKYPPYIALIGAILFTLGGTIVSLSSLLDHFQTAVWLPWAIFAWERVLRSQSLRAFLLVTVVLLLQFLAGSPELYVMSMALLFLDGLRIKTVEANISSRRPVLLLIGANVLVIGLAMAQVLPTVELFQQSRREQAIPTLEATLHSLHPLSLMNLFFLEKEPEQALSYGVQLFFSQEIPFFVNHYMGAISLLGICLWMYYGSRKEKFILSALIFLSLVLAMGNYTPAYPLLLQHVPVFGRMRFPEKFFFFSYALLLFVSLRGLSSFLKSNDSASKSPFIVLFSVCALVLLIYMLLRLDTEPLSRFISRFSGGPILSDSTFGRASGVLVNLERQLALLCGAVLLLFLWKKKKIRDSVFQCLIVGSAFVDLNAAHQPYQYLLNPDFVYKSRKVIATPDKEPYRIFYYPRNGYLHPNYVYLPRKTSFPEFNALVSANLLPNTGVLHGFQYMQELDALGRKPYTLFLEVANKLPLENLYNLLGALNVKYIIGFRPLTDRDVTLVHHFPEYPSWLYKINRVVPRAYIVPQTTEEKDPMKVLNRISSADFEPLRQVILEQPLSIPTTQNFQSRAEILQYKNQAVTIRASLNAAGVLVLADSFYPGWRVYVNGKKQDILRANLFFRGVALSKGDHLVEFRYKPLSFTIGLAVSLVTLCGLLFFAIKVTIRDRYKKERT